MANEKEETRLDRREFLKAASLAGVGLTGYFAGSVSGCATTEVLKQEIASSLANIKPEPVVYPKLAGNKVQPPENGCLVGFYKLHAKSMPDSYKKEWMSKTRDSENLNDIVRAFNKPKWDEVLSKTIGPHINYYEQTLGRKAGIFVLIDTPRLFLNFPTLQAAELKTQGIIPYLNFVSLWPHKPALRMELDDIAKGKHNDKLTLLAQGAANFGEKYGGYFVTTLHEMNGPFHYWGQSSKFKDGWKRIVDIFENKGANKYATWVWHTYAEGDISKIAHDPDMYYPGDEYADWIGLTAYSRQMDSRTASMSFDSLVHKNYEVMHKSHPTKPIMMAEFGKTTGFGQARWLEKAYHSLKQMGGIKAAILYHHVSEGPLSTAVQGDDKNLTQDSLSALREIVKDPYFIMAS